MSISPPCHLSAGWLSASQDLQAHYQRLRDLGQHPPHTLAHAPILNRSIATVDASKSRHSHHFENSRTHPCEELQDPYFNDGRGHSPHSAIRAIEVKFGMILSSPSCHTLTAKKRGSLARTRGLSYKCRRRHCYIDSTGSKKTSPSQTRSSTLTSPSKMCSLLDPVAMPSVRWNQKCGRGRSDGM